VLYTADELERELRRLQREHLEKMYGLQRDLDDLRMQLMMERNRPPPPPPNVIQQPAPPVSLVTTTVESLARARIHKTS